MSAITLNHKLSYKGREYAIPSIPRLVKKKEQDDDRDIDELGFRKPYVFPNSSTIFNAKQLLQLGPSVSIIIGEGDIGKTWFTEQLEQSADDYLHVLVHPLREFKDKNDELIPIAKSFFDSPSDKPRHNNLVLDGLDENNDAWRAINQICLAICDKSSCHIIITSRMCDGVRRLLSTAVRPSEYQLLPFSKDDVVALANGVNADGNELLSLIERKNISIFASRPGGATLLLKLYGAGIIQERQTPELMREIVRGFVHDGRDGVTYEASKVPYEDSVAADGAGWIATKLFFSQKWRIYDDRGLMCPKEALPYDSLLTEHNYDRGLLDYVIASRLIEPLSGPIKRFASDTTIIPFLVADWICSHVPQDTIPHLFGTDVIGETTAVVMSWIARIRPNYVKKWIAKRPLVFLGCGEAIEAYGVKKYYALAEKEFERSSENEQRIAFKRCDDTMASVGVLAGCAVAALKSSKAANQHTLFAAQILRRNNKGDEIAVDLIVNQLVSRWNLFSLDQAADVLWSLYEMIGGRPKRFPKLSLLKPLLKKLTPSKRLDDRCRGVLLMILWPEFMSPRELAESLTPHAPRVYGDAYLTFRSQTLPDSLEESVDKEDVITLLKNVKLKDETLETLFTYAWKWAEDADVATELAMLILECSDRGAYRHFKLPFVENYRFGMTYGWMVRPEDCECQQAKRFAVLDAVMHDTVWCDEDFLHMRTFGEKPGLFTSDEFKPLYDWLLRAKRSKDSIAERRLVTILDNLSYILPTDRFIDERNSLHQQYPERTGFDLEMVRKEREEEAARSAEYKREDADREAKKREAEERHAKEFQKFIVASLLTPELFLNIAHYVDSSRKEASEPQIDTLKAVQWKNFTEEVRCKVYQAADLTVREYKGERCSPTDAMAFCSSLYLTWNDPKRSAKNLSGKDWERIFFIATRSLFNQDEFALCEKMLSWGFAHYENDCTRGFLCAAISEASESPSPISILGRWTNFVTDTLISELIEKFKNQPNHLSAVLTQAFRVWRTCDQPMPSAKRYLSKLFDSPREAIASGQSDLFAIALAFCPSVYAEGFVEYVYQDGDAAKKWLESTAYRSHDLISSAFRDVDIALAARFYLKLASLYPPENNPLHARESTFKGYLEFIYSYEILDLSNRLVEEPSAASLAVIDASGLCDKPHFADLRERIAEELEKQSPPDHNALIVLTKVANAQRPLSLLTLKEYRSLAKELNKDLATKEDVGTILDEFLGLKKLLNIIREISLSGLGNLGKRTPARQKLVAAVIDKYYHLIREGTPERNALSMAVSVIEREKGLLGYKLGSLRNAADREINKSKRKYLGKYVSAYFADHPE